MKKILIIFSLLLTISGASAQNDSSTKKVILAILQKQEDIWNTSHDMDAVFSYFTEDATNINFLDIFWPNRADIIEAVHKINQDALRHNAVKFELKKLKIIKPDVAIANIEETLTVIEDYSDVGKQFKKGVMLWDSKFSIFIGCDFYYNWLIVLMLWYHTQ